MVLSRDIRINTTAAEAPGAEERKKISQATTIIKGIRDLGIADLNKTTKKRAAVQGLKRL